jgi:hypothetical protein
MEFSGWGRVANAGTVEVVAIKAQIATLAKTFRTLASISSLISDA